MYNLQTLINSLPFMLFADAMLFFLFLLAKYAKRAPEMRWINHKVLLTGCLPVLNFAFILYILMALICNTSISNQGKKYSSKSRNSKK